MGNNATRGPVLVFDGDCAFCTSCARLLARIGPAAEIVPWQLADLDELGITAAQAAEAVQWIGADGAVRTGHEAIAATLSTIRGPLADRRPGALAARCLDLGRGDLPPGCP